MHFKKSKQLLAVILSLSMVFSMTPINVRATEAGMDPQGEGEEQTSGDWELKDKSRGLDQEVHWEITGDVTDGYVLTITGLKEMPMSSDIPWATYKEHIKEIKIETGVKSVSGDAFAGCVKLEKVTLPEGLTKIGDCAFQRCDALSEIVIPRGATELGGSVFFQCRNIKKVTLPDTLTTIGNDAFQGCWKLEEINYPSGLTTIGSGAFSDCQALKSVVIPTGITKIEERAFMGCNAVKTITWHDGITEIGKNALSGMELIEDIKLPDNLKKVGDKAFYGWYKCDFSDKLPEKLEEIGEMSFAATGTGKEGYGVAIPKSVKSIGSQAFANCRSLNSAQIFCNVTTISNDIFADCENIDAIYVIEDTEPDRVLSDAYPGIVYKDKHHLDSEHLTVADDNHSGSCVICGETFAYEHWFCEEDLTYDVAEEVHKISCSEDGCNYQREESHHYLDGTCICGHKEGTISNMNYPTTATYTGDAITAPSADNFTKNKSDATVEFKWYTGDKTAADAELGDALSEVPKAVGTYTLVASMAADTGYSAAECRVKVTISKATGTATITSTTEQLSKEYNGAAVDVPAYTSAVTDASKIHVEYKVSTAADSTYTATAPKNAGTYKVRVRVDADDNYSAATSNEVTFTISKKTLTPSVTGTVSKVYDGTTSVEGATSNLSIELTDKVDSDNVAATANYAYADSAAGSSINVNATNIALTGSDATNYQLASTTANNAVGIITAKPVTGISQTINVSAGTAKSISIDVSKFMPSEISGATCTAEKTSDTGNIIDGDVTISSDKVTAKVIETATAGQSATITISMTKANYEISSATLTINVTSKTPVSLAGVTCPDKAYTGSSYVFTGTPKWMDGETEVEDLATTVQYVGTGDTTYGEATTAPINAGTYQAKFSVNTDEYVGEQTVAFTITKAAVTVKAVDKQITVGAEAPRLSSPVKGTDYTITGLKGSDSLEGTVSLSYASTPDTSVAGTVAIHVSGLTGGNNYTVTFTAGTLTIKAASGGGSGGSGGGAGGATEPETPEEPEEPETPPTVAPTVAPTVVPTPPAKGDVVEDTETGAKVEVEDTDKKTVTYTGADIEDKKVEVPSTVTVGGVEYKVTKIDDGAFENNKTVTEITVGNNVKEIGDNAFKGCSNLKKVELPKTVTIIGDGAFKGCSNLSKVTIPAKATEIGAGAFDGCKKLKQVEVPAKVKTIGEKAFNGCKSLKTLKIDSTKLTSKNVSKNAFKGISKNTVIKVPKKKLDDYKQLFKKKGLSSKVKVKGI